MSNDRMPPSIGLDENSLPGGGKSRSILLATKAAIVPAAAGLWAAIGTFWSVYAWYYQEIVVPSAAPVNLAIEIAVEKVGTGGIAAGTKGSRLQAIKVEVKANNVSTKAIHLLGNYWDAWAARVVQRPLAEGRAAWMQDLNKMYSAEHDTGQLHYAKSGLYYEVAGFERVAWGSLFPPGYVLHPKEAISSSTLFYVPDGLYDLVHVEVHIPTSELPTTKLKFLVDASRVKPKYYQEEPDGTRKEVTSRSQIETLKIQETEALRQLSLWKESKPAGSPAPAP